MTDPFTPARRTSSRSGLGSLGCLVMGLALLAWWAHAAWGPKPVWIPMRHVAPHADLVCVVEVVEAESGERLVRVVDVLRGEAPDDPFELPSAVPSIVDPSWWGIIGIPGKRLLVFLDTSGWWLREAVPGASVYLAGPTRRPFSAPSFDDLVAATRELLRAQELSDPAARRAAELEWLVSACERGVDAAFEDLLRSSPVTREGMWPPWRKSVPEWDVVAALDDAQIDRLLTLLDGDACTPDERAPLAHLLAEHPDPRLDTFIRDAVRAHCRGTARRWYADATDSLRAAARRRHRGTALGDRLDAVCDAGPAITDGTPTELYGELYRQWYCEIAALLP